MCMCNTAVHSDIFSRLIVFIGKDSLISSDIFCQGTEISWRSGM